MGEKNAPTELFWDCGSNVFTFERTGIEIDSAIVGYLNTYGKVRCIQDYE